MTQGTAGAGLRGAASASAVLGALVAVLLGGCGPEAGCGANLTVMLDLVVLTQDGIAVLPDAFFVTTPDGRRADVLGQCEAEAEPRCRIWELGEGGTYLLEVSAGGTHLSQSVEIAETEDGCHLVTRELTLRLPAP